jgi:hypothetical protein
MKCPWARVTIRCSLLVHPVAKVSVAYPRVSEEGTWMVVPVKVASVLLKILQEPTSEQSVFPVALVPPLAAPPFPWMDPFEIILPLEKMPRVLFLLARKRQSGKVLMTRAKLLANFLSRK